MQRILLYGATGRTGQLIIEYALARGFSITALVRNPSKITIQSDRLTVIKGLPTSTDDVRNAMKGCDVVISALSALSEKESMSFKRIIPPHTLETSIRNTIACMKEFGIKRIVTLSSIGAGDSYKDAPWYMRFFIKVSNFKLVFADHHEQEQLLINSNLDWTIARPVALNNNEETNALVISYAKKPSPFKMSRSGLAKFMVNCLDTVDFVKMKPILSEKK